MHEIHQKPILSSTKNRNMLGVNSILHTAPLCSVIVGFIFLTMWEILMAWWVTFWHDSTVWSEKWTHLQILYFFGYWFTPQLGGCPVECLLLVFPKKNSTVSLTTLPSNLCLGYFICSITISHLQSVPFLDRDLAGRCRGHSFSKLYVASRDAWRTCGTTRLMREVSQLHFLLK